jgi:hypothetical protein
MQTWPTRLVHARDGVFLVAQAKFSFVGGKVNKVLLNRSIEVLEFAITYLIPFKPLHIKLVSHWPTNSKFKICFTVQSSRLIFVSYQKPQLANLKLSCKGKISWLFWGIELQIWRFK